MSTGGFAMAYQYRTNEELAEQKKQLDKQQAEQAKDQPKRKRRGFGTGTKHIDYNVDASTWK
jgi:hypothetical protein